MTSIEQNPLRARIYNQNNPPYTLQPVFRQPQVNMNPNAWQYLKNLLGDFFTPKPYSINIPTQYQNVPLSYNMNKGLVPSKAQQEALQYLAPVGAGLTAAGAYGASQLTQNGLMRAGTGATLGKVAGLTGYPMAFWAASKLGNPAMNAVRRVADSPIGKWGAKLIDVIF